MKPSHAVPATGQSGTAQVSAAALSNVHNCRYSELYIVTQELRLELTSSAGAKPVWGGAVVIS